MDGIEKITARIIAEAREECAGISQEAAKNCEAIRADYAEKAKAVYENAVQTGETEIGLDAQRLVRNAKLGARKDILTVKQEMVDAAFDAAKKKLTEMPGEQYVAWLVKMAAEASCTGDEEIILSSRDAGLGKELAEKANAALAAAGRRANLRVSGENREIEAGFVLRSGNVEVNCTLDSLLEMNRQELAAKVAARLFD